MSTATVCSVNHLANDPQAEERIASLKRSLGEKLFILGHHYQRDDVIRFADARGDSFKLSQLAARQDRAEYIVFCGVHFMAESADILSQPHQKVILPDLAAGCSMADMADIDQVEECWQFLEDQDVRGVVPITYMNSTAAIKAFCGEKGGAVCTSSNAPAVFKWAYQRGQTVLFLPDQHLGRNTGFKMGIPIDRMALWDPHHEDGNVPLEKLKISPLILWKGHCSVHGRFRPEDVDTVRAKFPAIRVIVHPECLWEVVQKADSVGSTEHIIKAVSQSDPGTQWAVGTEIHLVNRLAKENPDKLIITLDNHGCLCTTMFRIAPKHVLWALENLSEGRVVNQIKVDDSVKYWAQVALDRMLAIA
ncbi:MAG TPA: quinolinate synthase NadA [Acidobacteriota bacterium]|jgi:quinolinate synthase|nr:quinolinate synthase NadA [Acidobacteriota bacterium]